MSGEEKKLLQSAFHRVPSLPPNTERTVNDDPSWGEIEYSCVSNVNRRGRTGGLQLKGRDSLSIEDTKF